MEKEFISYEQALALKEIGFDEHVFFTYNHSKDLIFEDDGPNRNSDIDYYNDDWTICAAPLKQQTFKFFRDKYDLYLTITDAEIYASNQSGYRWRWMIFKPIVDVCISIDKSLLGHLTYEEAENDCINKLIELAKQY